MLSGWKYSTNSTICKYQFPTKLNDFSKVLTNDANVITEIQLIRVANKGEANYLNSILMKRYDKKHEIIDSERNKSDQIRGSTDWESLKVCTNVKSV